MNAKFNTVIGWVSLGIVAVVLIGYGVSSAKADLQNPLADVTADPAVDVFVPINDVKGLDYGNSQLAVLTDSGDVLLYNSDMSAQVGTGAAFPGATGISSIPGGYGNGGIWAVSDNNGVGYFDEDWNPVGGKDFTGLGGTIIDISYDARYGRMLILTTAGTYENQAGTNEATYYGVGGTSSIESIFMKPGYNNMNALETWFYLVNEDGSFSPTAKATGYGEGVSHVGLTFTPDGAWVAVSNGVAGYSTDGFQENMIYETPEPATLTLLGLGAVALLRKRRKIHCQVK